MIRNLPSGRYVKKLFPFNFHNTYSRSFSFDVPVDSSITEEQLTRPRRKFSHFGMAVLGGWGLKKKRPLAVLRDRGGNGRCPLASLPSLHSLA